MCGRYTHLFTWRQLYEHLSAVIRTLDAARFTTSGPPKHYNVAPTLDIPALRTEDDGIVPVFLRWWLTPHWSKAPSTKYAMFNARSEDAASKPAFRAPFRKRRCVVPASGFFEWKKLGDKDKQPWYITRADGDPIYFAALWDRWEDPTGEQAPVESCAILTTGPNAEMRELHHRMPCVLEPEDIEAWCDPAMTDPDKAADLLRPAPDGTLEAIAVSTRVNNARKNNDPSLIEPQ